jgi:transcriptional regulator NrdR family protein
MKCPHCHSDDTHVVDSRSTEQGQAVRRRRRCDQCTQRFTTYERVESFVAVALPRTGRQLESRRQVFTNSPADTDLAHQLSVPASALHLVDTQIVADAYDTTGETSGPQYMPPLPE